MLTGSTLKVPLADLHAQYLTLKPEIDAAIQDVINSSQFILGGAVASFEQAFAEAHGASHCIGVGSGTDALHLALWASGAGRGDEVVTTPFTFIATVEAILLLGATPVFVDIDPATYTLDPAKLEEYLLRPRSKTVRAIIPVHLYGLPAEMDAIGTLARREGSDVIEDACQAHLARYGGEVGGYLGCGGWFFVFSGKEIGGRRAGGGGPPGV